MPTSSAPYETSRVLTLARAAALARTPRAEFVVSHSTAALLWGLPLVTTDHRVHVIQQHVACARAAQDVVRHTGSLDPHDRAERHGLPVTSLERTVVDCAASLPAHQGLAIADAGLRRGADVDRLQELVDRLAGRRGVRRARDVLGFADDGAESPGESATRCVLLRWGFPRPETQVPVTTHLGTAWSDLGWPEWRALVEYDGRAKYESRGSASEAVLAEKRREEALTDAGWTVVRVSAPDLRRPDELVDRVLRRTGVDRRMLRPRRGLAG